MATPVSKEDVIFNFKDGKSITYSNIDFYSNFKQLLLNGANANLEINPEEISTIIVAGQTFSIKEIETINSKVKIIQLQQ